MEIAATHDDDFLDAACGFGRQTEHLGNVGEWAYRTYRDAVRLGMGEQIHHISHRMQYFQRRFRLVQLHATQAIVAVYVLGGNQGFDERFFCATIHTQIRATCPVGNHAGIFAGVVQRHIARHGGEGQYLKQTHFFQTQRHQNGGCVVLAGVGVDDELGFATIVAII